MTTLRAVARKELRAWFLSPVALVFVATFLMATLFSFFWVEGFFARGIADTRPLFAWMPTLLAFLVPALGMRAWSEEDRSGTLELLQTLPLRTWEVVAGKFVAGLALVGVALALTLPVPATVWLLGPLDWGPVLGGYAAALLLAGAYLAITLFISSTTRNALVALGLAVLACGGLVVVGSEAVVGLFGHATGEVLRALSAGSRFEAIVRGVLDLRDVAWFASVTGLFLALNVLSLDARRWSAHPASAARRWNRRLGVGLLAANLLALNAVFAPVRGARLDLTEDHRYSVSSATTDLLEGLDEPLVIRGYFSSKTHPLLAPLVPEVRDLIEEYGAIGGDRVRAELVDPTTDAELEEEAARAYGIRPVPFQFADRHEASVVNAYFHVLVRYGDQSEVLDFEDLIEVDVRGMDVDVRLRNLEYDLTRAVQKAVYGFVSPESVFARLPEDAVFTAVVSEQLPEGMENVRADVEAAAEALAAQSGGRLSWSVVDPDAPGARLTRDQLYETYGLQPLAVSPFASDTFYLHFLLQVGDRVERILPREALTEDAVREAVLASLKRAAGVGTLKTVGFVTPDAPSARATDTGHPPRTLTFDAFREVLAQSYRVVDVDLSSGQVPPDVDVLFVLAPDALGDVEVFALDQHLMRGGSAVVATSDRAIDPASGSGLRVTETDNGLADWLAGHGIEVGDGVVLDLQSESFPVPVTRDVGGFSLREIQMLRYPAFPDVRPDGFADGHPALAGLPGVVLHWPSAVRRVDGPTEAARLPERTVLLSSSAESWEATTYDAQPTAGLGGELGWAVPDDRAPQPLAVAAVGPFRSAWAETAPPELEADRLDGGVLEASPESARLVVVGSASFLSDPVVQMSQMAGERYLLGLQLGTNLVDWSVEDVGLLQIRARSQSARALLPTDVATRQVLEWANYAVSLLAVAGIGVVSFRRRRRATPIPLDPPASVSLHFDRGAA